ncbi:MAG: insulinase family protein [Ignavibacteria bacterium]|nr:insulinase family protein [Ignavibacteria bacterium]
MLLGNSFKAECKFNPIKFVRDSLPNGLQIIYSIDRTAPIVATVLHYKVGSRDEHPQRTGFAHFFEHLMFEATENIPRASIDKYVQEAGGTLNAHTSFDETVYYFKLPSNYLNLALWIEAQRMRKLKVDSAGVETQRGVVIEELRMRYENQPYGTMFMKMSEKLFEGSTYGWPTIGYIPHIEKATIPEFQGFYDNFYKPNNAILVIVGDIDIEETRTLVREYFEPYPSLPPPKRQPYNIQPLTKSYDETVNDPKAQLPGVFIGFRGPKIGEKDYYAMSILTQILASGESSRLYRRLVDKEQVAVSANMFPLSLEYSGGVIFYAIIHQNKSLKKTREMIMDEIKKIASEGVTEAELVKAKNIIETEFIMEKRNVLDKATTLARYLAYFNDPSLINNELEKYLAVTNDDIKRVAKNFFHDSHNVSLFYHPNGYSD